MIDHAGGLGLVSNILSSPPELMESINVFSSCVEKVDNMEGEMMRCPRQLGSNMCNSPSGPPWTVTTPRTCLFLASWAAGLDPYPAVYLESIQGKVKRGRKEKKKKHTWKLC